MPDIRSNQKSSPNNSTCTFNGISSVQAGWIIVLLSVLTALAAIHTVGIDFHSSQKWEYKIASPSDLSFEKVMNEFGADDWELVTARRATSGSGYSRSASYEVILKRPVSTKREAR